MSETIPADVMQAAQALAEKYADDDMAYHGLVDLACEAILSERDRATAAERERCARRLVDPEGYFNAPAGFYEALSANTVHSSDTGEVCRFGDTGNWAAFFYEMLKPFAAAIRNPMEGRDA